MKIIRLPGLIDPHVHLRDPGQTEKEDFTTGTSSALAGGFTAIIDMPNNKVPITTVERLREKQKIAQEKIVCDVGFYFGTLGDNLTEFDMLKATLFSKRSLGGVKKPFEDSFENPASDTVSVFGLKIYLNKTTGNFLLDKKHLEKIFQRWPEELPLLFHAEEKTFDDVLEVVKKHPRKIHLCHMSTEYELQRVMQAKKAGFPVTCGVTPHHLFLTEKHFKEYGSFALMRPPLRSESDVRFLWKHLDSIDCVESDHAPHTWEEKHSQNPPYGIPGLETTLPLLLTAVSQNAITIDTIIRLCHSGPKQIFGIDQGKDTFIEVDLDEEYVIDKKKLFSKAKWTPFDGWKMKGKLKSVYLRGKKVFADGMVLAKAGSGRIITKRIKSGN